MKALIVVLLIFSLTYSTYPIPPLAPLAIKELSGLVEAAVWRSGFKFTRVDLDNGNGVSMAHQGKFAIEDHWIIVLSEIKGINQDTIKELGAYFIRNEPKDNIFLDHPDKAGQVLIWIPGGKNLMLKRGKQLTLKDASFQGHDDGAEINFKSISIYDDKSKSVHEYKGK